MSPGHDGCVSDKWRLRVYVAVQCGFKSETESSTHPQHDLATLTCGSLVQHTMHAEAESSKQCRTNTPQPADDARGPRRCSGGRATC